MASIVNAEKIIAEYGKYYLDEGQNKKRLIRSLVQPSETLEKYARHIRTSETTYRMANFQFGSLIQPFSTTFTPVSSIEFFPNEINLSEMKVNVSITPHEIEEGYLGFMAGDSTRTMQEWPIVRWLLEEYLAKQIAADRELKLVYGGKKKAGGVNPEDCMDGIHEKLLQGVESDYPINVISGIGTLDESSIFDQVEHFDEQLPALYNQQMVVIFMAPKWVRAYKKSKRSNNFYFISSEKEIDEKVDFSKHYICPLPSMTGTDHLWASVADNLLWLTKREGNLANASIQLHHYNVDIMLDWWEGVGFACNQMVWCTAETVGQESSTTASGGDVTDTNLNVITNAITDITHNAAVANGELNGLASLAEATLRFYYGTSKSAMNSYAAASLSAGILTGSLTSLSAATKYYVKAVVTIGNDSYAGKTVEFTTTAAPLVDPICVTTPASSITAAGATLNASYTDAGSRVTGGGFEYGTDMAGTLTDVTNAPAAGANSKAITGLTAATTYYVRAYVLVGTTKFYGGWSAFATSAGGE